MRNNKHSLVEMNFTNQGQFGENEFYQSRPDIDAYGINVGVRGTYLQISAHMTERGTRMSWKQRAFPDHLEQGGCDELVQ